VAWQVIRCAHRQEIAASRNEIKRIRQGAYPSDMIRHGRLLTDTGTNLPGRNGVA
jgi:hypothetical protein